MPQAAEVFNGDHVRRVAIRHDTWSDEDLERLQVTRGDPAGQARQEAYTLHLSIFTWRHVLMKAEGDLIFISDALGVLHNALKRKALASENATCDALSRLDGNDGIPTQLHAAMKSSVRRPTFRALGRE